VLWEVAESWALIGAEIVIVGETQPGIFLVHRKSSKAIIIGSWPTLPEGVAVQTCASSIPSFNPAEHFGTAQLVADEMGSIVFLDAESTAVSLTPVQEGGLLWSVNGCVRGHVSEIGIHFNTSDQCTISSSAGSVLMGVPAPGPLQRGLAKHIVAMATERGVQVRCDSNSKVVRPRTEAVSAKSNGVASVSPSVSTSALQVYNGDRVDVEYCGEWYRGVLQHIDGEVAHVRCDVDEPSVVTLAHISSIRPAMRFPTHHAKSKSWACPN
jgi:hypothetical protein